MGSYRQAIEVIGTPAELETRKQSVAIWNREPLDTSGTFLDQHSLSRLGGPCAGFMVRALARIQSQTVASNLGSDFT